MKEKLSVSIMHLGLMIVGLVNIAKARELPLIYPRRLRLGALRF